MKVVFNAFHMRSPKLRGQKVAGMSRTREEGQLAVNHAWHGLNSDRKRPQLLIVAVVVDVDCSSLDMMTSEFRFLLQLLEIRREINMRLYGSVNSSRVVSRVEVVHTTKVQ